MRKVLRKARKSAFCCGVQQRSGLGVNVRRVGGSSVPMIPRTQTLTRVKRKESGLDCGHVYGIFGGWMVGGFMVQMGKCVVLAMKGTGE